MSYEEKSVWIQFVAMVIGLGAYFFIAGQMLLAGVRAMPAFAAVFMVSVVAMVIFLVVSHTVAAILSRPEGRDERDRLISWRAEHNSSWVLGIGVLAAITGLAFGMASVWAANLLLLALVASEMLGFVLQLLYYRRGVTT